MSTRFLHLIDVPRGTSLQIQIARRKFSFATAILRAIGPSCWLDSIAVKRLRREATIAANDAAEKLHRFGVPLSQWESSDVG